MEPGPWAGRPDSATRDASCPQRKGCVCLKHHPSSEAGVQPGPCLLSGSPVWGDQGGGAGWGEQTAPYPHPAIEAPLSICPDSGQGHTGDPGAALGGPARSPHSAHFVPTWMEDNAAGLWQAQPPSPPPPASALSQASTAFCPPQPGSARLKHFQSQRFCSLFPAASPSPRRMGAIWTRGDNIVSENTCGGAWEDRSRPHGSERPGPETRLGVPQACLHGPGGPGPFSAAQTPLPEVGRPRCVPRDCPHRLNMGASVLAGGGGGQAHNPWVHLSPQKPSGEGALLLRGPPCRWGPGSGWPWLTPPGRDASAYSALGRALISFMRVCTRAHTHTHTHTHTHLPTPFFLPRAPGSPTLTAACPGPPDGKSSTSLAPSKSQPGRWEKPGSRPATTSSLRSARRDPQVSRLQTQGLAAVPASTLQGSLLPRPQGAQHGMPPDARSHPKSRPPITPPCVVPPPSGAAPATPSLRSMSPGPPPARPPSLSLPPQPPTPPSLSRSL